MRVVRWRNRTDRRHLQVDEVRAVGASFDDFKEITRSFSGYLAGRLGTVGMQDSERLLDSIFDGSTDDTFDRPLSGYDIVGWKRSEAPVKIWTGLAGDALPLHELPDEFDYLQADMCLPAPCDLAVEPLSTVRADYLRGRREEQLLDHERRQLNLRINEAVKEHGFEFALVSHKIVYGPYQPAEGDSYYMKHLEGVMTITGAQNTVEPFVRKVFDDLRK